MASSQNPNQWVLQELVLAVAIYIQKDVCILIKLQGGHKKCGDFTSRFISNAFNVKILHHIFTEDQLKSL